MASTLCQFLYIPVVMMQDGILYNINCGEDGFICILLVNDARWQSLKCSKDGEKVSNIVAMMKY